MDLKKILFIFAMVLCTANSAWAYNNYYAQLYLKVANDSSGKGTVYASTSDSDTGGTYDTKSYTEQSANQTNEEKTFYAFAKPIKGYKFDHWASGTWSSAGGANEKDEDDQVSRDNPYTVTQKTNTLPDNRDGSTTCLFAHFVPLYTITVSTSIDGGAISADLEYADVNDEVTLYNTPKTGYKFDSYSVVGDDGTSIPVDNTTGKFTMPAQNVTVSADFVPLISLTISGTPTKTTYDEGDALDPAGLVVTGTYSNGTTAEITEDIIWTFDPLALSAGDTTCGVTATVGSVSSNKYTVTGLTVNAVEKSAPVDYKLYDNNASVSASPNRFYRIPALAVDKNGDLYAYGDYRYKKDDIGYNQVEIRVRKSTDNGATWTAEKTAISCPASSGFDWAHGDAAVVADREGKGFLMMCASGSVKYSDSNRSAPIRVGRYTSRDGINWTGGDVTDAIYNIDTNVTKAFFTSGRICQSRFIKVGDYYRIYSAMCTNKGSLVVYSDDFGKTWKKLGDSYPASSGDEAKVEELPNGNVLLSCRASAETTNGRYFNIFTYTSKIDAKGGWLGTPATSNEEGNGTYALHCSCNGEILIVPAKDASGNNCYVALQSTPKGSDRYNLVIYYKVFADKTDFDMPRDFTTGWSVLKQISTTTSAYSTMVLDKNGDIAFFYEEDYHTSTPVGGYNLKFQTLSLSALTNGAYTYSADLLNEKTNNNEYLGITSHDDLVGNIVTLNCVGYTSSTTSTFNEYIYNNNNAIGTTSTAPTSATESTYQFKVAKGFNGGYTFQSVSNSNLYLGVSTGKMTLESYPAEFILTTKNKSTACAATAIEMDGFALQYYYPSDMENTATVDGATAYDDATRFVAIKNVDGTAPDRLNYTTKSYGSYFSTDFTIGTKYEVTEDNMNVKVLGTMNSSYEAGALTYLADQETATKTDNSLVYVEDAPTYTTTANNVVVKGSDGSYTCQNLVLTDKVDTSIPIAFTAANATYTRESTSKWGTIMLPYAPVKKEGYTYFTLTSKNDETTVLTVTPVEGDLAANTPYLIKNETGANLNLSTTNADVAVAKGSPNIIEAETGVPGWTMIGVYERITVFASADHANYNTVTNYKVVDPNAYYIKSDGTQFAQVNGSFNGSAFRAYFSAGEDGANSAKFALVVGESAIDGIDTAAANDEIVGYYNAYGVQQNDLQEGLNIIKYKSGKSIKVMIK